MTYNDKAVLENFHASAIFHILRDENYNILANLKKEEYRLVLNCKNSHSPYPMLEQKLAFIINISNHQIDMCIYAYYI